MKTEIKIDNEFCRIVIFRDGFIMSVVHFMSENNHGENCKCLTEGEACKLSADIAHATNPVIDAEIAHSKIRENLNKLFSNREIEL